MGEKFSFQSRSYPVFTSEKMRESSVENGGAEIFYDQRKVLSPAGFEPTLPGKEGRPGELPFILIATLVYPVPHAARK